MTAQRSEFMKTMQERGFLQDCTDSEGLDELVGGSGVTGYIGFDATADSLHVGSLIQVMMLRRLQQTGNKPLVLMGGGTTRVGDPSGRDTQRQLLTSEKIAANIAGIRRVFERFLTFGGGPSDALMVNNAAWLDELKYIDFLREIGSHFSVSRMLALEAVRSRLDRQQALSFLEFNYPVLQAYDFRELSRRYDCRLQLGGSDQWGNIVAGIDLAHRLDGASLYGLTSPLLATASGAKMGKTADGAVWLNSERTSAYDYWQYWRNVDDADVGRFLRLFTEIPLDEIARLEQLDGAEMNEAKIILADMTTTLCHGATAAENARQTAQQTFVEGAAGEGLPKIEIPRARLSEGVLLSILLREAGLADSSSAARRLIKGGGARINNVAASDENAALSLGDVNADGFIKLSSGRKRHVLLCVV